MEPIRASSISTKYNLIFNIVKQKADAIDIGVKYRFEIPDFSSGRDVFMSDFCRLWLDWYGEGYVQFLSFDSETRWVEGVLVFDFSVPEDADSNNLIPLHIEGNFRCLIY